jgi:hypothetical protein
MIPRRAHTWATPCEIGYTWLTRSAVRTAANTESKLLMLTHAFETWQVWDPEDQASSIASTLLAIREA